MVWQTHTQFVNIVDYYNFFFHSVPSGAPNNIIFNITSSTSVILEWNKPDIEDQNGVIKHYTVTLSSVEGEATHKSTDLSLEVTGLHPYYTYISIVQAVTTGAGPGANTTFTMPQDG